MNSKEKLEKIITFCESIVKLENKQFNDDSAIEVAKRIMELIKEESV
ncbi:hypothetical protein [Neobacillus sp. PS3-40]|nr:hypothetical protein [Neobacillus sp. PS3-40]WML44057.1 hypothetical protein RCG20_20115 [Neobacillus sp. PS3-40]